MKINENKKSLFPFFSCYYIRLGLPSMCHPPVTERPTLPLFFSFRKKKIQFNDIYLLKNKLKIKIKIKNIYLSNKTN